MRNGDPSTIAQNQPAAPVPFKDLANNVKKHPSGADALDLTRCVIYAVEHPDENWMFPTDYKRLIDHLGGPATLTPAHYDRQVFARRNNVTFPTPKPKTKKPTDLKRKAGPNNITEDSFVNIMSESFASQQSKAKSAGQEETGRNRRSGRLASKNMNFAEESGIDKLVCATTVILTPSPPLWLLEISLTPCQG